ncbi:MAG: Uma2 family endonuclease [Epsilonproteobacteria bacterium]|nr:Uma2 family endonuclease [Campylobacterota bacterium]
MCAIEYYTYEDYKHWEGDWELIRRHPISLAQNYTIKHQLILQAITYQLMDICKDCFGYPMVNWVIDYHNIVRPDISFCCETESEYILKTPEIVVEVISKTTAKRDEKIKFEIYEKEKVPYYILAYPDFLKARVFKHNGKHFEKMGNFTNETIELDTKCKTKIDFNEVFKRFRK